MNDSTTTSSKPAIRAITAHAGHLSPPFNPKFQGYVLLVSQETTEASFTIDAGDGVITINGVTVESGRPTPPVPAPVGRSQATVTVTAPDGQSSRSYTLTIRRPHPIPTWQRVADTNPWPPRDSAGELVFNNHLWLFGGYTPKVINDVWRSPDGIHWEAMPPIQAGCVNIPIRFVFDGHMWLTISDAGYVRSPDGIHWTTIKEPMPWAGRTTAGSVVFKNRIWILGGLQGSQRRNDVWSSADGLNWRQETPAAPWSPRQLHDNVVVHDNMIYLIGGGIQGYHPWKVYRDVWRSPDGIHWEEVTPEAPWEGRNWASCLVYKNRIWLLAGFRAEPRWANFNDVWYSPDGADWRQLTTPDIWSPRHEVSPYVFQDKLWVVGGNAWPLMNDAWHLDIPGLCFLTSPPVEEFIGAQYNYHAKADFNHSRLPIRYRLLEHPDWLSINPETGLMRGIPPDAQPAKVTLQAFDDAGETVCQSFSIHVI